MSCNEQVEQLTKLKCKSLNIVMQKLLSSLPIEICSKADSEVNASAIFCIVLDVIQQRSMFKLQRAINKVKY